MKKTRFSRLERLLAQPDIFTALRKIGDGTIKSYDDLDMDAMSKFNERKAKSIANQRTKPGGSLIGDKIDKQAIEEFENGQEERYEILKLEK